MSAADNKRLVRRYFDAMRSGDPTLPDLLADDVTWWAPPSSPLGGVHSGKPAVVELMQSGVGLYDTSHALEVSIEQMSAEGDWVSVQMILEARTAAGAATRNQYHFSFRVGEGRICEVREYLDTPYEQQKLF